MKVLIVDDDIGQREMLGLVLRTVGHDVQATESGPRCLKVAERFAPDVVMLDLQKPVLYGLEVAKALRRLPEGRGLRIVVLSDVERLELEELHAAGCNALVRKPAAVADVLATLARGPGADPFELAFLLWNRSRAERHEQAQ